MTADQNASDVNRADATSEPRERLPYQTPRLAHLGSVRELTLSGNTTSSSDPGTTKKPGG